jgi:hypothetical protein
MRRFVAFCPVAVIGVAVLAGCGGSSSKSGTGASSDTSASGGGGSSSSDDLSKLVADASKQKYKVTYDSGDNNSLTYAQDGNGDSVFGEGDSLTYVSKGSTVGCEKSSGTWQCTQSPVSVGAIGNPFTGVLSLQQTYFSALGDHFGKTSNKTIAGRDAECITFSQKDILGKVGGAIAGALGKNVKGSATYCIDKQTGTTLEVSGTDESGKNSHTLVVTKFETPSASDFTPPATPKKVPGISLPAGITLPSGVTLPPGITLPSIPGGG